jgi:hypothetical protein
MAEKKLKPIVRSKVETETLIALATADTVTEAAEKLGVSRTIVYERIQKYGLTEKLKNIQESALVELATGAGKAARNLISKIDSENEDISVKASTETLDRVGLTKPNNARQDQPMQVFNQIQINQKDKYDL